MAVKELFASLFVSRLAPSPKPSCVNTLTRRAQCWNLLVFGCQWFVSLPEKSSGPFVPQDPIQKGVFLRVVVDVLFVKVHECLSFCFFVDVIGSTFLRHRFTIVLVVEVLLYVFRSSHSTVLSLRL
jgi:hypothetical protein